MSKYFNGDMTVGNPVKLILLFTIPILIGNVFQQLYNVVDTAVIGHVLGDNSLAAVGSTSPVYMLIVGFATGVTNGFSVVLARFYGKKDMREMEKTVCLTVVLTCVLSAVLTLVSMLGMKPLLRYLNTPENIMDEASLYLAIILAFCVVTMLYNMLSGMLRSIGNSKAPLWFLIIATVINIVLDIIFVKYLSLGVAGAAYATIIAQLVSVILCVVYIKKKCPLLHIKKESFIFDKALISELITTGISMGLMLAIVSIGSVALQGAVNSLGSNTIAAHTSARKLQGIFSLPLSTLCVAASTYASQNFGAGKLQRVKKGVLVSIALGFVWSAISIVLLFAGCNFMVSALTGSTEPEVLSTAARYIYINVPFFFVLSVLLILRSSLQGVGKKIVPLAASVVELLAKFIAVGWITSTLGYFGVCIIEPIIWSICAVMVTVDFILFIKRAKESTPATAQQ